MELAAEGTNRRDSGQEEKSSSQVPHQLQDGVGCTHRVTGGAVLGHTRWVVAMERWCECIGPPLCSLRLDGCGGHGEGQETAASSTLTQGGRGRGDLGVGTPAQVQAGACCGTSVCVFCWDACVSERLCVCVGVGDV